MLKVVRYGSLALVLTLVSCGQRAQKDPEPRRLNLVLVTIDTLRPDRLGCYGYTGIETPNLDRLAQSGVLFENAAAQAPLTAPSHASIMTGMNPPAHKVRDTGGFVLGPTENALAVMLQRRGWDTAAFVGSSVMKKRFGLNQGFSVYDDDMAEGRERRAGAVVDRAVRWLGAQSGKPFFLWVHVYDPHLPYDPPADFRERYKGKPYDGEIAYTDQQLGQLFEALGRKSPSDTVVAVMSDHGESFSEHGEYAHGVFLYDATLRIAFMIAGPGVPRGMRVKQQARSIDFVPTVLELIGMNAPRGVQGSSLVPSFTGKEIPTTYSYAETLFPKINMGWVELRGIRTNRWKYVRAPHSELYDLASDPGETHNVIGDHPAEARELEARLGPVTGSDARPEKVQTAMVDRRTLSELKSLGYLAGSTKQEYELTGKGVDPKDRTTVLKLLHRAVYADPLPPTPQRISMLRRAIAEDPQNPALYSHLGQIYTEAARPAEAMNLYQDAIKRGIRAAWLYSRIGYLFFRAGDKAQAITYFEKAAQLNPADYESMGDLAAAYRETGKLDEAEQICKLILKSGEEYAPAYNELGMALYQKGDASGALGYFERAARLDPTYQLNLARLYKNTGDPARARASYEAFLTAKRASPEYRDVLPQVRQELASLQ